MVRGARRALVVVDMPFGSYEENPSEAFRNAHGNAGARKPLYVGPPEFEGFEVIQTVPRDPNA